MSAPLCHDNISDRSRPRRGVLVVLIFTATYMIAEAIGGYLSNSLALLADAGHMLADVAALSISFFAFVIVSRPANSRATFGYYRAEILAALFNGLALLIVAFFIVKEAIIRIQNPTPVKSEIMIYIAVGGLLINLAGLYVLSKNKDNNLNIKGAWLHVLSDTLGSVGVIISGLLILSYNLYIADPIASLIISGLISYSSVKLILETLDILMEHTPKHINSDEVLEEILSLPDILGVHDLHIWSITSGKEALSVHVEIDKSTNSTKILELVQALLQQKFGITHTTIQIEQI